MKPPLAIATLVFLVACGPAPSGPVAAPVDGWYAFEGTWDGAGSRRILPMAERRVALIDLRGTLLLAGKSRPGVGFRGEVVAMNDTATGLVGRAVWTDERGDKVFSEIRGEGVARANRITGSFVGGTGRYAGATGTYEFAWQYVLEAEDGLVQGRSMGLKGRVRFDAAPAEGGKP